MATVNFLYRSVKSSSKLTARLMYRIDNKDFVVDGLLKTTVDKVYWNNYHKNKKRPKDADVINKQADINHELELIRKHIMFSFAHDYSTKDKSWLTSVIQTYYNPNKAEILIPRNLVEFIDFHLERKKNELSLASKKKFNVVKHKLMRFESYTQKKIRIFDVDDAFKNAFVDYCKSEKYAQNTIQRDLVFIKSFCKQAKFLGLETSVQLDSIRIQRGKAEKIYLTLDELAKIENTRNDLLSPSLKNARDWLLISCYTGQRISDFMKFKISDIEYDNNYPLIQCQQKKTKKRVAIPLHPKVLQIISNLKDNFPYAISDQKYNDYVKDVCRIAKIDNLVEGGKLEETVPGSKIFRKKSGKYMKWELVTSHIGRRSFATNFYGKYPLGLLIQVTGHSTEEMFQHYIGKTNVDSASELAKMFANEQISF